MIVFMAACQTLQCLAAGMNGEANEPQPAENSSQLEDPPANQNGGLTVRYVIGRLQSLLLDGCSVYCL